MVEVNDKVFVAPLYGQKDNIAVITGPAGAGAVLNEGDYNTWTKEWIAAIPDSVNYDYQFDAWIDDKHDLIYITWRDYNDKYRWGIFNTADFSTVFLSASGSHYTSDDPYCQGSYITPSMAYFSSGGVSRSIQTYLLLLRYDYYTFEVWRNGSKLKSQDIRSDFHTVNLDPAIGGISLTGKYLLFLVRDKDPSPDLYYLMLYKGSYV